MAVKKAAKRAPAKKKTAGKRAGCKSPSKAKVKVGDQYKCSVCGLVVSVDEACGCVETCDIICCEKQMKKKR